MARMCRHIPTIRFSAARLRSWVGTLGLALSSVTEFACASSGSSTAEEGPTAPSVSVASSIVHGAPDRGRHPAVVAIVARQQGHTELCSGALIAPDLVLTARHCVSMLIVDSVECPPTGPQVGDNRLPESLTIIADERIGGAPVAHGRAILTPDPDVLCDHDIALIRLDAPVVSVAPLEIARTGEAIGEGRTVTAIGYGAGTTHSGERRFRTHVRILATSPTEFEVGPSTCPGDSGGPAIDPDSGKILGVVSRGVPNCTTRGARNVYTRVDAIAPWIDEALGARASPMSVDAQADSEDASGNVSQDLDAGAAPGTDGDTVISADDSATSDEPMPADPDGSPAAPGPTLGDLGEPCIDGASCATGLCVTADPTADPTEDSAPFAAYCSRSCGPTVGRCPRGYRCARTSGVSDGVCARKQ